MFVFPSLGGQAAYFGHLQQALGGDFDLLSLERVRESGLYPRHPDQISRLHLEQIKASGVSAPYFLIGHSYGGQAAYYTAVALQKAGEEVAFVGVIDDEADVHRRRFNINQAPCVGEDPIASGRQVIDANPLYRFSGKVTLIKSDIGTGARLSGPACDWDFLTDGGVEVFVEPYTHTGIVSAAAINEWAPNLHVALDLAAGQRASYSGDTAPDFFPSRLKEVPEAAFEAFRYSKSGDLAAEIDGYQRALALNPKAPDWIAVNLAAALRQNGQIDEAIAVLQFATQDADKLGNAHFELVGLLSAASLHADRVRLAESIVSMPSDSATEWHFKGILLEQCQRVGDSIAAYCKAIELAPEKTDSRSRCVSLMQKEERIAEAKKVVEDGLKLDPESGFLNTLLGEIQLAYGCSDDAEKTFRHVIETDHSVVRAVMSLARMLIDASRLDDGDELIKETLKRHPGNPGLHLIDAEIHVLRGDKAQAEIAFRRAIELHKEGISGWVGLAKLMLSDQRHGEALELLRSAPQQVKQSVAVRMQAGEIALANAIT
ncbi:thioesterase domain-containing protein [Nioella aestuarii]|uniref:thioesterase domain-containing protein n=1 Tax=Nioella aestuarii TaxID=1662864 RepID=UPI003D7F9224